MSDYCNQEHIIAAAIRVPISDVQRQVFSPLPSANYPDHLIVSAPPPSRHHSIMHPFHTISGVRVQPADQGFLTSHGRFVGRAEALSIAKAAGQPLIDHPSRHATELFSEDLW